MEVGQRGRHGLLCGPDGTQASLHGTCRAGCMVGLQSSSLQVVDLESNPQIALTLCLSNLRQMAGGHHVLKPGSRACSVSLVSPRARLMGNIKGKGNAKRMTSLAPEALGLPLRREARLSRETPPMCPSWALHSVFQTKAPVSPQEKLLRLQGH